MSEQIQLSLFIEPVSPADSGLTCAFGEPWMGAHPLCESETERACQSFNAAVARGEFDTQGYTPNERKAQAKRARAKVNE